MAKVKVPLADLTARVNTRLPGAAYHQTTISSARHGKGAPALVEVVRMVEAEILREAADEAATA